MSDSVEHPSHYNAGGIETIDGIRAALGDGFLDYCRGNVLKYVWRCRHKGKLLEDLRKAAKYLEWAIEAMEANALQSQGGNHVEGVWIEEAGKIESTEWIPKVGDKVLVVKTNMLATGRIGVVSKFDGKTCSVRIESEGITSFGLEAKDLELVEAAQ